MYVFQGEYRLEKLLRRLYNLSLTLSLSLNLFLLFGDLVKVVEGFGIRVKTSNQNNLGLKYLIVDTQTRLKL